MRVDHSGTEAAAVLIPKQIISFRVSDCMKAAEKKD